MNSNIGFIGCGNMGSAIISGIQKAGICSSENMIASDIQYQSREALAAAHNIKVTSDNIEVAKSSDILFLAVKPNIIANVITEIKDHVKPEVIIVSIAAGQSLGTLEQLFNKDIKIIRVMPNTPALVGEGMAYISPNSFANEADVESVCTIFASIGKAEVGPESYMDAVTGISGSSPAYTYLYIEALVAEGMPRSQAYTIAAQAVLGAAKMVLETGRHPGLLKDQVCSPGGTTIEAVCELEKQGFRNSVISAVRKCVEKSRKM